MIITAIVLLLILAIGSSGDGTGGAA